MSKAKPLIWCDPPAKRVVTSKIRDEWAATVDQLRARPGEWAMLRTGLTRNRVSSLQGSLRRFFPDCQFVSRKVDDADHSLWGRADA